MNWFYMLVSYIASVLIGRSGKSTVVIQMVNIWGNWVNIKGEFNVAVKSEIISE